MCKDCPPQMIERMAKIETVVASNTKLSQERHTSRIDVEKERHILIMGDMAELKKLLREQNIKELDKRYPTRRELKVFTVTAGVFSGCLGFIVGTYLRYFR